VAGKWTAGAIRPVAESFRQSADPTTYLNQWVTRQGQAFSKAFGDPYFYSGGTGFINEPVFRVPQEGDTVNLSAVSVAPDGRVWFASAPPDAAAGPSYGIAVWDGHSFHVYSPTRDLGLSEENVQDLVALPDGRMALAFRQSGVVLWNPASGDRQTLKGLPDPQVYRLELDTMMKPAVLHISTMSGATLYPLGP
jgi:hypothetical protein